MKWEDFLLISTLINLKMVNMPKNQQTNQDSFTRTVYCIFCFNSIIQASTIIQSQIYSFRKTVMAIFDHGAAEYTDKTLPNKCPVYDPKPSDSEVPVMLGLWGIRSTPSLPLLPGPLCPGVVVPDRAQFIGWIELTAYLC